MSKMEEQPQQQQQQQMKEKLGEQEKASVEDLLPLESSPYVKYKDLDDYKNKAYGTEGHVEPKPSGGGGGGTDAPTLSGSGFPEVKPLAIDAVTRQGLIPHD